MAHELVSKHISSQLSTSNLPDMNNILSSAKGIMMLKYPEIEEKDRELGEEACLELAQKAYTCWYKERSVTLVPIATEETTYFLFEEWPFMAIIDYLCMDEEGKRRVVDLKVGRKKRDPSTSLQLGIYALAHGIEKVAYDTILLPGKRIGCRSVYEPCTLTQEFLTHTLRCVKDVVGAISAKIYPRAQPDSWVCSTKYCGHYQACRGESK